MPPRWRVMRKRAAIDLGRLRERPFPTGNPPDTAEPRTAYRHVRTALRRNRRAIAPSRGVAWLLIGGRWARTWNNRRVQSSALGAGACLGLFRIAIEARRGHRTSRVPQRGEVHINGLLAHGHRLLIGHSMRVETREFGDGHDLDVVFRRPCDLHRIANLARSGHRT